MGPNEQEPNTIQEPNTLGIQEPNTLEFQEPNTFEQEPNTVEGGNEEN
jgi:hypothetical protein